MLCYMNNSFSDVNTEIVQPYIVLQFLGLQRRIIFQ
jgi:hypothetical protein